MEAKFDKLEANLPGYILIATVLCAVLSTQQFMPKFVLSKTAKLLHCNMYYYYYYYYYYLRGYLGQSIPGDTDIF